jgi:hypothetical protein
MGQKREIKQFDNFLQKRLDKKDFVKIKMSFFGEEENLSGFILDQSTHFLLLQTVIDFRFDGYAIISKYDFESIRCNRVDKTQKKILDAEGALEQHYGINTHIILDDWNTVLNDLMAKDFHVIIENVRKDYLEFNIGSIEKISSNKIKINNYDATGKLNKKPVSIKINDIRIVKFGDTYSTIFRKYLK